MKEKIIVTGSNGQLGTVLVAMLIELGYVVIGLDRQHTKEIQANYVKVNLDITDEIAVKEFFDDIADDELIAGLVNNAGAAVFTPFADRTYNEVKAVLDVNIVAAIFLTQQFMRVSKGNKCQKRVVNIGSIYGHVAPDLTIYNDTPRMSSEIYGMTKAAIINFTQYLASYYKEVNARFNCVSPGGIESSQGPLFKSNYSKKVPMNRMAGVAEVAEVICFLISDKSSYINGENIFVDGGLTKW
jgi:NAD(P)-dependent dehydrogenase (short-subunit alcohol dehydrogenase family)